MGDDRRLVPAVVAEPGRNVLEQLIMHIESDVDKAGWDQPNRLFRIDLREGAVDGLDALTVYEIPWPEELGRRHPADVIPFDIATVLTLPAEDLKPEDFAGVALAIESWAVETLDPESPELRRARERRELHLHPDRIEVRIAMLIAFNTELTVYRRRGRAPEIRPMAECSGTVPDALRALFAAFVLRRALAGGQG